MEKTVINLAVLGGGRRCRKLIELVHDNKPGYFEINIRAVCDRNKNAEGMLSAEEKGIFTTTDLNDLYKIDDLDNIIELTGDEDVLIRLISTRPENIGIFEHNSFDQLVSLFMMDKKLKTAETQILFERMIADFLMQESSQRILVLNTDFTIEDVNTEYLSHIGKTKDEVIGTYCYSTIQGFNVPCSMAQAGFTCPMIETLRTGKSTHIILEDPDAEEISKYIDVVTYPVKNEKGEIKKVIEVWRDITDQFSPKLENRVKIITEDMKKLIEEDRMVSLGKLSASCVHEINNPIQGLITYSYLMKDILEKGADQKDLDNFKDYLSIMANELTRCGEIVSGLLSFSRENISEFTDVDLNEILKSVISLTGHKMMLQNIEVKTKLHEGFLYIKGDTNSLQQCFLNLIFNAEEAMKSGGTLNINSYTDTERDKVVLEFKDSGTGIDEKDINRIFEPFFTTKGQGEGTGLGLSIVYGIVKNHTGDIRVENENGAKFIIEFPLR